MDKKYKSERKKKRSEKLQRLKDDEFYYEDF